MATVVRAESVQRATKVNLSGTLTDVNQTVAYLRAGTDTELVVTVQGDGVKDLITLVQDLLTSVSSASVPADVSEPDAETGTPEEWEAYRNRRKWDGLEVVPANGADVVLDLSIRTVLNTSV